MQKKSSHTPGLICDFCHEPKVSTKHKIKCDLCAGVLCKDCVKYLEESFFSFLKIVPDELGHITYCWGCYEKHVEPAMKSYLETMEQAKEVYVFKKNEKHVPVMKRARNSINAQDCPDKAEAILRLAFFAAEENYNAVIEINLSCKKIRTNGYQKSSFSATGVPAQIRVSGLRDNIS